MRTRSASEGVAGMRAGLFDKTISVPAIKVSADDMAVAPKGKERITMPITTEHAKSVTFAIEKSLNTETSIDSNLSDDGESDIDDVPEALVFDDITVANQTMMQSITQKIDLAAFFQGSRYRIISLLFGPMACFFFVA